MPTSLTHEKSRRGLSLPAAGRGELPARPAESGGREIPGFRSLTEPWDRQEGESSRAYEKFSQYLKLGPGRSLARLHGLQAGAKSRAVPGRLKVWSAQYHWTERAGRWDEAQARVLRERLAADQVAARVRHARLADASLRVSALPSSAALLALRDDPGAFLRLGDEARASSAGLLRLVSLAVHCAAVLPALVAVERKALGMVEEMSVEVTTVPRTSPGWKIPSNPKAVALAVELLDALTGGTES